MCLFPDLWVVSTNPHVAVFFFPLDFPGARQARGTIECPALAPVRPAQPDAHESTKGCVFKTTTRHTKGKEVLLSFVCQSRQVTRDVSSIQVTGSTAGQG